MNLAARIRMIRLAQWVGVLFRVKGLTVKSLWIDEVASVITVDQPTPRFLCDARAK